MTVRDRKRMIRWATVAVGLAAAAVLAAGLGVPVRIAPPDGDPQATAGRPTAQTGHPSSGDVSAESRLTLAELQQLCAIDLRRPLAHAPTTGTTPAMPVHVIGTLDEPGHSMVVLGKPDGSTEVCASGDSIDDPGGKVTVVKVKPHLVTLQYAGQSFDVVVPPMVEGASP